ncbi:MAG: ABC transporter substrate-binding (seleno)protein SaoB [Desulfosporosinus sp.]
MNKKRSWLYEGIILIICVSLVLSIMLSSRSEMPGLRIACNDDAAGLLIKYLAGGDSAALDVVNMSYQQLLDCCSSQTELALAAGNFDMAVLCPDGAEKLLAGGQPYQILGAVAVNAMVLVTNQDAVPRTVGYMNAREIQKELVWSNYHSSIEMKPMLPAGLPYALERKVVEGIVLDILGALKIGGYRTPLFSEYPTSVLVVHQDLCDSPELTSFIKAYNQAVGELNNPEILMPELAKNLAIERGNNEVKVWKEMGVQFQTIKLPS